jgi:hypothetical protein
MHMVRPGSDPPPPPPHPARLAGPQHQLLLPSWLPPSTQRLPACARLQVAELKDSTRYERTLALLQKYDPGGWKGGVQRTGGGAGCCTSPATAAGSACPVPEGTVFRLD